MSGAGFTVIVPVKGTAEAKSRLGAGPELAAAIAVDTVAACVEARLLDPSVVASVVVVTVAAAASEFEAVGATVLQDSGGGLNAAVSAVLSSLGRIPAAVMLGDLPALQPAELLAALRLAKEHDLAFVADSDGGTSVPGSGAADSGIAGLGAGTGTTLITALDARDHRPAFGAGSRAAHLAAGYIELDVPTTSGLRRDVDTPAHLAALRPALGPRTARLFQELM